MGTVARSSPLFCEVQSDWREIESMGAIEPASAGVYVKT
jgi:hypothetical protein